MSEYSKRRPHARVRAARKDSAGGSKSLSPYSDRQVARWLGVGTHELTGLRLRRSGDRYDFATVRSMMRQRPGQMAEVA